MEIISTLSNFKWDGRQNLLIEVNTLISKGVDSLVNTSIEHFLQKHPTGTLFLGSFNPDVYSPQLSNNKVFNITDKQNPQLIDSLFEELQARKESSTKQYTPLLVTLYYAENFQDYDSVPEIHYRYATLLKEGFKFGMHFMCIVNDAEQMCSLLVTREIKKHHLFYEVLKTKYNPSTQNFLLGQSELQGEVYVGDFKTPQFDSTPHFFETTLKHNLDCPSFNSKKYSAHFKSIISYRVTKIFRAVVDNHKLSHEQLCKTLGVPDSFLQKTFLHTTGTKDPKDGEMLALVMKVRHLEPALVDDLLEDVDNLISGGP